ncbi:MAG TPA: flavoprotein [Streptosporangiaceae bacterium]|nr:flavoprotein [Streptosporangiaceae bacterium]
MPANEDRHGVLYVIVCAAPHAREIGELVTRAQSAGWTVCVVATPQAIKFIDIAELEQRTGYPVRHEYKHPDEPDVLPAADAMIVCPATFNTINKWAVGISDTLAVGLLTEAIGLRLPLVAVPSVNSAQAVHRAFARSLADLRAMGVTVLYGPGHESGPADRSGQPGAHDSGIEPWDWDLPLTALHARSAT